MTKKQFETLIDGCMVRQFFPYRTRPEWQEQPEHVSDNKTYDNSDEQAWYNGVEALLIRKAQARYPRARSDNHIAFLIKTYECVAQPEIKGKTYLVMFTDWAILVAEHKTEGVSHV
jgi:hypothetical protein